MKKDGIDRFLQNLTYGAALLRVLRGENARAVLDDTKRMVGKADKLKSAIERASSEPSSNERERNG